MTLIQNVALFSLLLHSGLASALAFKGTARDQESKKVVYLEEHDLETDPQGLVKKLHTRYLRPDGSPLASITSDFSRHPTVPDAVFEDRRFKRRETSTLSPDAREVTLRVVVDGQELHKKSFKVNHGLVVGQGFDNFIRKNFEALAKGTIPLTFGVMAKADVFDFLGTRRGDGAGSFGIKIDSMFLRLFLDELRVDYDPTSKRLLRYRGLSNIPTDQGKDQMVDITYEYAP
jgi:hypothetical protein